MSKRAWSDSSESSDDDWDRLRQSWREGEKRQKAPPAAAAAAPAPVAAVSRESKVWSDPEESPAPSSAESAAAARSGPPPPWEQSNSWFQDKVSAYRDDACEVGAGVNNHMTFKYQNTNAETRGKARVGVSEFPYSVMMNLGDIIRGLTDIYVDGNYVCMRMRKVFYLLFRDTNWNRYQKWRVGNGQTAMAELDEIYSGLPIPSCAVYVANNLTLAVIRGEREKAQELFEVLWVDVTEQFCGKYDNNEYYDSNGRIMKKG